MSDVEKIDLDYLAELAHAVPEQGPWHTTHHAMGQWTIDADGTPVAQANGARSWAEPTARFIAALDPETVLTLINAASAWLGSRPRPEPKAPTGLTGDEWRPWWVLDRTGASTPKGMWSKAIAESTVQALGDPERYKVDQADPEE